MKQKKGLEIKIIYTCILIIFAFFLLVPLLHILGNAFLNGSSFTTDYIKEVLSERNFSTVLINSFKVSIVSAVIATLIAFFMSYTIQYTNVNKKVKKLIKLSCTLPMLLPTITYGFAIIYSFGKQGLLTKLFGKQLFDIYGFNGMVLGFVIYTLPIAFMLISNTMLYIDRKFMIVSKIMGDNGFKTFKNTLLKPLLGTLAASFIQAFFLSFTDFGIPASVGGQYSVVASSLYSEMLGSLPNFNTGAVIAIIMLIPSIVSILLLTYLEKYNIRYQKISTVEIKKSTSRDVFFGGISSVFSLGVLSLFLVIFLIPFIKGWPYDLTFTFDNIKNAITGQNLGQVYLNSIFVAILTAVIGMLVTYGAALVTARSKLNKKLKKVIENISIITNTIPGMVLGIAYLLMFTGTSLQNTFPLIIICNVIHYFSTPYLMFKNSLEKMNSSWETTAMLMGDNWVKTIIRVVTPNAKSTIFEVLSYYFVNAMVTISAIVFLVGTKTMVITTKIKELQHFAKFNEIFILSLMIMLTNVLIKIIFEKLANKKGNKKENEKVN
ncbi:ABC transporter permease subunit [Anaerofustis stercorihominis]|uniref:ABC transporter, permease protein n=2 Tax=Anaerofustis stercorihominis TaxID=214853 RepID=B1C915_9FIRM|nr:ABC transporter permease subunit [Anaerofustis stercorihominis]EDS72075.1 ABC transporter, permease protein [Anaerofustis stercorihominis DSM 17244]MCQ4795875.1 ABC transporter permease subunit [Anaerofustis stercorihominis]RGD75862.1 ABC transporter permease subunit [Anaerofustis stercorihominis]